MWIHRHTLALAIKKANYLFICCSVIECVCVFFCSNFTYLNMNINRMSNEKNIATLSMVRNITKSCRRRFGMNLTNFKIRNSRNVRSTLNPELPSLMPEKNCWPNSNTLFVWVCVRVVVVVMLSVACFHMLCCSTVLFPSSPQPEHILFGRHAYDADSGAEQR